MNKDENWFSSESKLGIQFAIFKGTAAKCTTWRPSITDFDFNAIKKLYKVRIFDFINLKSQLEEQISLNNKHQISPM